MYSSDAINCNCCRCIVNNIYQGGYLGYIMCYVLDTQHLCVSLTLWLATVALQTSDSDMCTAGHVTAAPLQASCEDHAEDATLGGGCLLV